MSIFNPLLPKQSVENSDQPSWFSSPFPGWPGLSSTELVPSSSNSDPTQQRTQPSQIPKRQDKEVPPAAGSSNYPEAINHHLTSETHPTRQPPPVPKEVTTPVSEKPKGLTTPTIRITRATEDRGEEESPLPRADKVLEEQTANPLSSQSSSKNVVPNNSNIATSATNADQSSVTEPSSRHQPPRKKPLSEYSKSSSVADDGSSSSGGWSGALSPPHLDPILEEKPAKKAAKKHKDTKAKKVPYTPSAEPFIPPDFGPVTDISASAKSKNSKKGKTKAHSSRTSEAGAEKIGIRQRARRKLLREPVLAALLGRSFAKEARDKLELAAPKKKKKKQKHEEDLKHQSTGL